MAISKIFFYLFVKLEEHSKILFGVINHIINEIKLFYQSELFWKSCSTHVRLFENMSGARISSQFFGHIYKK